MGNILNPIKKFLSNKNTVTILGVLLGVVVLYIGYSYRVNQTISPVSIPYAKQEITSRTKITEEMIGYTEVPRSMLNENEFILQSENDIVGKYVNYGAVIPEGAFFYSSIIVPQVTIQDNANIPDGYTLYPLDVDLDSTYGNSIFPDQAIDLYLKTENDAGEVVFGKLIEKIRVLTVKDDAGQYVFETASENRTPAVMIFAVPDCMFNLLNIAEILGMEVVPVPRNVSYTTEEGATEISSQVLQDLIYEKAMDIPDLEIDITYCTTEKKK